MAVATSVSAGNFKQTHRVSQGKLVQKEQKIKKTKLTGVKEFNQRQTLRTPITVQPEGELRSYIRSGEYVYPSSSSIYYASQNTRVDIVYGTDNEVYLKNILCGANSYFGTNSWVAGTIDGNTITVPLDQSIAYVDSWGADILLCWGTTAQDDEGYWDLERDFDVTEAIYVIDGETITLQGTSGLDDDSNFSACGLSAYWSDDDSWTGFIEWNTVLTYTDEPEEDHTVITEQPEGQLYSYYRTGDAIEQYYGTLYQESQSGKLNVVFGSNGKAYIQDPLYLVGSGSWVEGDYDWMTGVITIPTGQYLSWNDTYGYGIKLMWGSTNYYESGVDEETGEPVYDIEAQVDENTTEIYFMIDDDRIYLLGSQGDLTAEYPEWANAIGLYGMWSDDLKWIGDIEFNTVGRLVTLEPAVPANPTADEWYDYGNESGYSKFYFTLPTEDVNGNPLDPEYLSYSVFVDNGNGAELFTFPAEDYTYDLTEDITEVPYYLYSDAVDFKSYFVYIYRTNAEGYDPFFTKNVGIQVYYTVEGVKNESDIVWLYEDVEPEGLRGDVNGDETVNVADATALIDYLLSGDDTGINLKNADCDLSDSISVSDVTALIDYLLGGVWPGEE